MKHLSHIPLILLMLWSSAVSYATEIEVQSGYKTKVCIKNVFICKSAHGSTDLISFLIELRNSKSLVPISQQTFQKNLPTENVRINDKLYFLAYEQGRFGILNTMTREIDYVSDPIGMGNRPDSFTQLKEIQASDDKVYVLANDRTLHVFQKF